MIGKLSFLLLLIPFLLINQLAWKQQTIDDKVVVLLPNKVEKTIIDNKPVWIADLDSTAKCMVMITDLKKMGIDAKTLAEMLKKKSSYEKLKSGILSGYDGAKVSKETITIFKNYPAYYLEFDLKGAPDELNKNFLMNVFIETKMYSISFMESYDAQHEVERSRFMNSLKVK